MVMLTAPLFRSDNPLTDYLDQTPNPKPTAADKAGFGRLASLYTAYSSEFAKCALEMCLRAGYRSIGDPFGGMGTLAEAGRTQPIHLQLADISPFAALTAAFRSAPRADIEASVVLLKQLTDGITADDETKLFSLVFRRLEGETQTSITAALRTPSIPKHRIVALTVYLTSLSRLRLYKKFSGSNPTWVKRPRSVADGASTIASITTTLNLAEEFASRLPDLHSENQTSSIWTSIEDNPAGPESLDAIVTSPPYANRTDYIRHYLPACELLLAAAAEDERLVRLRQIGTPLIRQAEPTPLLPPSALEVLHSIRTHSSYASKRYYYKGFLYYFSDMFSAIEQMHRWLRRGGLLVMVVQDTYYKELYVPTADVLVDVAIAVGFKFHGRRDWRVRQYLSHLSPHSRRSLPNRKLNESVIAFSR
jgi:hypothetical protein